MTDDAFDASQRFGLRLAGVNLLTPEDRPAQFIALAAIYPLPLAPRRVRGLTQVHGHPVTVLDPAPAAPTLLPALQRHAILVIGDPADAPIAFLVDEAPRAVQIAANGSAPPRLPTTAECAFAGLLVDPRREVGDPDGGPWWQADFRALFELLIRDGESAGIVPTATEAAQAHFSSVGDDGTQEPGGVLPSADGLDVGQGGPDGPAAQAGAPEGGLAQVRPAEARKAARPGSLTGSRGGRNSDSPGAAARRQGGRRGRKRESHGE